ncbi:D-2-hydroxyacid dehydrogenase [Flavobacterium sp. H122]|uniref:D-2-hydroxyacid dehydrogenase n=1 Tax=Flavobacterium sp. H122 TaxID=2529860 RepID=UPI0010AA57D2|nr:D-2-hydroxyacid dehydrogenase [Flavobacterium sp. H122]
MKILANDGLSAKAITLLEQNDFEVITTKVAQEQVGNYINKNEIDILLVRSATKAGKELIENCPTLKAIGRGGIGLDNIDVEYAISKGITVFNTPEASVNAVAELAIAHLLSGARYLHDANRNMPLEGDTQFNQLKKVYSNGLEIKDKTLGIIGFGKIGKAVAKKALGLGMKVIATGNKNESAPVEIEFYNNQKIAIPVDIMSMEELLPQADFISIHVPAQNDYLLTQNEFKKMKHGVGMINCSRGELINEVDLIDYLENKQISFAGLDVFQDEPTPAVQLLMHPDISLTPHIGGSTIETQEKISLELANQIITLFK